jgi:hypothetical protein
MNEFSLRQALTQVLKETDLADPKDVAEELLDRIPKAQIPALFQAMLHGFVRQHMSADRIRNSSGSPVAALPVTANKPPFSGHAPSVAGAYKQPGSAKVSAIRDGWQRRLRDRVHTESGWKLFSQMTYDDFLYASKERQAIAANNEAWARRFNAWARLLTEYDVETFGKLPVEVQMNALSVAA